MQCLGLATGVGNQEEWVCIDFRRVNDLTIKDSYSFPKQMIPSTLCVAPSGSPL